jgi:hypothetical protein
MGDPGRAAAVDYGPEEQAMRAYCEAGAQRAAALGNRGPIRFDADGRVHREILDAYWRCGFYVFEGVLKEDELADIEADIQDILERLPVRRGAPADRKGRPALGADLEATTLYWARPLGDPFGGTELAGGRHPVKMFEPKAAADAPAEVVYLILGSVQFSEAVLRAYGHPHLLAVAAAVNGDDFAPFNEGIFIKEPGRGASVAWHQDGLTHWNSPDWDQGAHGFNFMAQLYGCTPANGVWVVPGSHKIGKADIRAMVAAACPTRCPSWARRATSRSPIARSCTAPSPTRVATGASRSTSVSTGASPCWACSVAACTTRRRCTTPPASRSAVGLSGLPSTRAAGAFPTRRPMSISRMRAGLFTGMPPPRPR